MAEVIELFAGWHITIQTVAQGAEEHCLVMPSGEVIVRGANITPEQGRAFATGYINGRANGVIDGRKQVQSDVRKLLGL
jgi:hypothetical protein